MENSGVVKLYNTKRYPFNDSAVMVALPVPFHSTGYSVLTSVQSSLGEIGDIVVSGKTRNGFKIAYTGSASEAEIYWKAEEHK